MKIKKILVSQPQPTSGKSSYFDIAEQHGAEVIFRPFIKVAAVTDKEFRSQRISLPDYTAVVFTAKTAIDHYFHFCKSVRFTVPDTMRYFCASESVALYLQKYITYRKRKICFGKSGKLNDLTPQFTKHNKEKFLIPVSDVNNPEQFAMLDSLKVNYQTIVMYHTVSNEFAKDEPFDYDALIFFTPAGVDSLFKNFPEFKQGDMAIGCFGEAAIKTAQDLGLEVNISAPTPECPSMTGALEKYLKEQNG